MSETKESPILFLSPMVRAILEGKKTQTRRVAPIKRFEVSEADGYLNLYASFTKTVRNTLATNTGAFKTQSDLMSWFAGRFCRYGTIGDRLWVRETWTLAEGITGNQIYFAADETEENKKQLSPWKPSIFMRRADSRITLEITNIRVERVQDISPTDVEQEGVSVSHYYCDYGDEESDFMPSHRCDPVERFKELWSEINGADSWNENVWVWVIEFKTL